MFYRRIICFKRRCFSSHICHSRNQRNKRATFNHPLTAPYGPCRIFFFCTCDSIVAHFNVRSSFVTADSASESAVRIACENLVLKAFRNSIASRDTMALVPLDHMLTKLVAYSQLLPCESRERAHGCEMSASEASVDISMILRITSLMFEDYMYIHIRRA
jgi:hypothetical protein